MTISTALTTQVAALKAAFDAAQPLADAAPLVYADVRDKARDLVDALDAEIVATSAAFDAFDLPSVIETQPAALIRLAAQCGDQVDLFTLRSLIGRVRTNVNLAQV